MKEKGFSNIFIVLAAMLGIGLAIGSSLYFKENILNRKRDNVSGMANPASVNCKNKKGKSETRTAPSGAEYGVCKFNDGTECGEWAFMNGICKKGQYQSWEENVNKQPNFNVSFYTTGFTKTVTEQTSPDSWTKNTWSDKGNAKYLFLGMLVHNISAWSSTAENTTLKIEGDINKEITIPVLSPGGYSQKIPIYIPLPPKNNILKVSINSDKSIPESDYYDNYIFVSLKDGTTMTERKSFNDTFDYETQIADQLTYNDLKLINRIQDFPKQQTEIGVLRKIIQSVQVFLQRLFGQRP